MRPQPHLKLSRVESNHDCRIQSPMSYQLDDDSKKCRMMNDEAECRMKTLLIHHSSFCIHHFSFREMDSNHRFQVQSPASYR